LITVGIRFYPEKAVDYEKAQRSLYKDGAPDGVACNRANAPRMPAPAGTPCAKMPPPSRATSSRLASGLFGIRLVCLRSQPVELPRGAHGRHRDRTGRIA